MYVDNQTTHKCHLLKKGRTFPLLLPPSLPAFLLTVVCHEIHFSIYSGPYHGESSTPRETPFSSISVFYIYPKRNSLPLRDGHPPFPFSSYPEVVRPFPSSPEQSPPLYLFWS